MKRTLRVGMLLFFAAAMLPPGLVYGRSIGGRFLVGPVGGVVRPKGEMKSEAKTGFNAGISAEVMISNHVSLGAVFAYTRFGTARHVGPLGYGAPGDTARWESTWRLFQLGAHGTFFFASSWPLNPFVRVGASAYSTQVDYAGDADYSDDRLAGAFSLGAGVACQVSRSVRGTLDATYSQFDRLNDFTLWGPAYDYPALEYWSLNFALAFQLGPK